MDKLQELTQRLYEEGLSKGKAEGEEILARAKAEAEAIVLKAKEEAEQIVSAAEKEAAGFRTKVEGDVKMAAVQAVQATRADIEQLIVAKVVDGPVSAALSEPDFLKGIIVEVAKHFSAHLNPSSRANSPRSPARASRPPSPRRSPAAFGSAPGTAATSSV